MWVAVETGDVGVEFIAGLSPTCTSRASWTTKRTITVKHVKNLEHRIHHTPTNKCKSYIDVQMCADHSLQWFTFELNDTNNRPSTSSSSGCIATVNDGLWATLGETSESFHSLPLEFPQRLFTLLLFLRYLGDDPGEDAEGVELADNAEGVPPDSCWAFGVMLTGWISSLGSILWLSSTSTRSPRAWLPLIQGTYSLSFLEFADIMGFRTSLVGLGAETGTVRSFGLLVEKKKKKEVMHVYQNDKSCNDILVMFW